MRNPALSLHALVILITIGRSMCNGDVLDDAMNKALTQFNVRGASVAYFDKVGQKRTCLISDIINVQLVLSFDLEVFYD